MHRLVSADAMEATFIRPKNFDLETYDDDGRFGFGEGKRIRLTFRIEKGAGQHLLESPLSEDQTVNDLGRQYEITATVVETEQLEWWLKGFGRQINHVQKESIERGL